MRYTADTIAPTESVSAYADRAERESDNWYEAHLQEVWAEMPQAERFWGIQPGAGR